MAGPRSGTAAEFEYVVVGSGAGGGPLAANLAEAGHRVLVLEAGGDALDSRSDRLPEDYQIPAFHPFASENDEMKWDFFVRHYAGDEQQRRDPKFSPDRDGVLYPRAGTLGGCTAHNALIFVYPHNADWDSIHELTGDASWKAGNMRKYLERMEDCHHRPPYRWLRKILGVNPTRHGFAGWLATEKAIPRAALRDEDLMEVLIKSARAASQGMTDRLQRGRWLLESQADPNDWRLVEANAFGLRYTPLTTREHVRVGSRERLLDVQRRHPERLRIELDALATRVVLDDEGRAVAVEYLKGKRLYRAHANPSRDSGEKREALASREIILSGGAFNTPQLLMLSGIGPKEELDRHGIQTLVDLPGVGINLQDRYEVSVVHRMREDWDILRGAHFQRTDPLSQQWASSKGAYITNGGVLTVTGKSGACGEIPDLFLMGLMAKFNGYFPGYSAPIARHHNYLSWVILKAHTNNTAGTVSLRSDDSRDMPLVNFRYFDEGNDAAGSDLEAVVDGIEFVRRMTRRMGEYVDEEELPGREIQSREDLRQFVKDRAWGHHASCTCPIGPKEKNGVLNSRFQVHGAKNLRVVDASVFPRIPGFFIVSSVYMIAEKASDVILDAAR